LADGRIFDRRDSYGGYFEDFTPGDTYRHWPGKTVTEADNHIFTLLTMNTNPLHIDEHYMSEHQHGKILVVGPLVLSLVVGMSVPDTSGKAVANLEYESIKHTAPVFQGDTLYAESVILETTPTRSRNDRGIVYMESRGYNQRDETVLTLRRRFLVPRRPTGDPKRPTGD
jgi:acyl dehydratase